MTCLPTHAVPDPDTAPPAHDRFARFNPTAEERALVLGVVAGDGAGADDCAASPAAPTAPASPTLSSPTPASPVPSSSETPDGETIPFHPARPEARVDGWTPERQRRFILELSETGSVTAACRAVGMSRASAYALRRRTDARDFSYAWERALEQACRALNDGLWERAMAGQVDTIRDGTGAVTATRHRFDNRLAMWLLRVHDPVRFGAQALNPDIDVQMSRRRAHRRFPAVLNRLVRGAGRQLAGLAHRRDPERRQRRA